MQEIQKIAILIPIYNDLIELNKFLPRLISVISNTTVAEQYSFIVIIVDDGSRTTAAPMVNNLSAHSENIEIYLLRHPINLGQGAALQTALEFARDSVGAHFFATMDSDGQHSENDLVPMLSALKECNCDIIFGNRFRSPDSSGIPSSRKFLLKAAVIFEKVLTGLNLNDAHNGYRVFNRKCAELIELKLNRMAHATEFKQIVKKNNLKYGEHPVQITYSNESLAKGQKNSGAFVIIRDLFKTYLFERI
jgi:glycosyltransferase involved in cell wall biosynthesis